MNVLSLFDGMSCGQIALERAGIKVSNYFASEIDRYAIQVARKNYPETLHVGDVRGVQAYALPKIDLLIGGSPCQDLSIAKKDRKGLKGENSGLFYEYVRLLKEVSPKLFLLENVASMSKGDRDKISKVLGVDPIEINSALVSAQNRKRLYWTNIPGVGQPQDRGVKFESILECSGYPFAWSKSYRTNKSMDERIRKDDKSNALSASPSSTESVNGVSTSSEVLSFRPRKVWNRDDLLIKNIEFRKLTPIECERLQTVPDNYTEGVSNTQRYKMLGNGWTVDVIAHIFKNINQEVTQ